MHIDVEEGRYTSQGHSSTVLFLDCSQVAEVYPLESFLSIVSRLGNVESVSSSHFFQFAQSANLFGQFFTKTNDVFSEGIHFKLSQFLFLGFGQEINTVQSNTAIVADDAATAISVRKTRDNAGFTHSSHFRCICIKHALVMRFADIREHFNNAVRKLEAISFSGVDHHLDTAERLDGTSERSVSLNTDDLFLVLVDVARFMGSDCGDRVQINIPHAASVSFFLAQLGDNLPQLCRVVGRTNEERFIAFVRLDVLGNKIIDVNFLGPFATYKIAPSRLYVLYFFFNHRHANPSIYLYDL
ncbi:hypothetical protein D3C81_980250 [compost metagenome]